ncbi:AraC family transcriptional regulator [Rhizobium leguminosarum]|nr:AraC family transcriptional regulator [Rhizobium leguminosarum]
MVPGVCSANWPISSSRVGQILRRCHQACSPTFRTHSSTSRSARYNTPSPIDCMRGATASPRQVKRAIEFMRAHLHEVLTLEQIVQASGGSTRALQLGFQQFKFTSPMRYLKDLRLEAVHKELLTGDNVRTIAQVAQTWQFFQLGRFAADYHSRFGELPSQTFSKRG